uniref:7TM GPCR serpentine receptor class x (Srx) domain-containing protein n=1 Tax=Ascaris lumbricoides TaxID=6252 RepID=A0A9J2Q102_ASCLU
MKNLIKMSVMPNDEHNFSKKIISAIFCIICYTSRCEYSTKCATITHIVVTITLTVQTIPAYLLSLIRKKIYRSESLRNFIN